MLAEGGFGRIYVARQLNIDRKVAVKVMRRGSSDELVARFEAEAKIISELRHPNTLKLFDYGKTPEGTLYLVTELLSGRTLADALRSGPPPLAWTLEILREICLSLDEAHGKGIIHRDLKPANIFLEKVGAQEVVKVLDFGVAKVSPNEAVSPTQTMAGTIVGTPAYMSPEVVDARPIDARSDLYSLGVVAYECLTGRVPFLGSAIAQIAAHGFELPKPPSELAAVDPRAEALVMRLLEKRPEARPQSASQLAEEIERLMESLAEKPRRMWPVVAIALAAVAAVIAVRALGTEEATSADAGAIEDAAAVAVDAGFDFGDAEMRATPSFDGWPDAEGVLAVLRDLTPVLLECYGLIEAPRPALTVEFTALHSGTTVAVEPAGDAAAKMRECFAFRRGRRIDWPGRGRASIALSMKE